MQSVCVFLGSSFGTNPAYARAAAVLGREIAARGLTCVYGGSNSGLMGLLADSVLAAGGKVIGVTVQLLHDQEIFHRGLTSLHVVPTMHQRKALMADLADAFIAFPGGIGTFDEFFEIFTWAKLGFHAKPFGLLDLEGYYAPLHKLLDHAERDGFLAPEHRNMLLHARDPAGMLDELARGAKA